MAKKVAVVFAALMLALSTQAFAETFRIYGFNSRTRTHNVFLGTFEVRNNQINEACRHQRYSIFNQHGRHGSQHQRYSIWNNHGNFGSAHSSISARNPHASNPPVIVNSRRQEVGTLTNNRHRRNTQFGTSVSNILRL